MLPIPFDNPATYPGHSGVDYGQRRGTPFPASGSGVVTWLGRNDRGGFFIWVKYDAIAPEVGYHHMDSHNGCPPVGARFNEGDRLGYVGNTGNSTGPHLHSEVRGYETTDGYWRFFDRNRVVGGAGYPALERYGEAHVKEVQTLLIKAGYDLGSWGADGKDGPQTQAAVRDFQSKYNLMVDGIAGPETLGKLREVTSAAHPVFPLPAGWYFGPQDGPVESVSGYHGNREGLRQWQQRMADRGWGITVDGLYGDNTASIARQFQAEKGLTVDGLIGVETWNAAWTAPVTPPSGIEDPGATPHPNTDEKTYPFADKVIVSPNCEPRKPGSVITHAILHHTANPADHTAYFSRRNERSVAPNLYPRPDGSMIQCVRLDLRAWTTGVPLDHNAVTFEIENADAGMGFTDATYESVAKALAWLSEQSEINGVPVRFTLDREHVIGHREAPGVSNGTSCPGVLDVDRIVARALELTQPGEPVVSVPRAVLERLRDKINNWLGRHE